MGRRCGFSLFQLLILIAMFALGFALLLPAVAAARLMAAQVASASNLRQLGIGVHNYADTFQVLPAGVDARGFSTAAYLLPYLEQDNIFRRIDFKLTPTDKANAEARATAIKVFVKPLDTVKNVTMDSGPTNYLFSSGTEPNLAKNDGMFFAESKIKFTDVADGLSNTMMAGETLKGDSAVQAVTPARQHIALKADALKTIKPDTGVDEWKNNKNIAADRGAAWMDGKLLNGTFTATRTVNDQRPDVTCDGLGGLSGLRGGTDGVWILLGDGSTRILPATVPLKVIQVLAGRNDNMVTPDF